MATTQKKPKKNETEKKTPQWEKLMTLIEKKVK